MQYDKAGSIVDISNASSNINNITGFRNKNTKGVIINSYNGIIEYLLIEDSININDSRYIDLKGLVTDKKMNGYIDLSNLYVTNETLNKCAEMLNDNEVYSLIEAYYNYNFNIKTK